VAVGVVRIEKTAEGEWRYGWEQLDATIDWAGTATARADGPGTDVHGAWALTPTVQLLIRDNPDARKITYDLDARRWASSSDLPAAPGPARPYQRAKSGNGETLGERARHGRL
jgi:hypothetical protein